MATKSQLLDRLRIRIGEPGVDEGTWDNESELSLHLNTAQVEVARDLHTRGYGWGEKLQTRIPVVGGAEYYILPENFMAIEKVAHVSPQFGSRQLHKYGVQDLRQNTWENIESAGLYAYYEVRGRVAVFNAVGTADVGSDNETLVDRNGNFSAVRVGDICHNINDISHAPVVGFDSGSIALGEWIGGSSQRFYAGESYRVASRSRSAFQLWVYPRVESDPNIAYSGNPANFELDADTLISGIQFQVVSVPSDWEADEVVNIGIIDPDDAIVSGSRFGLQNVKVGYNTVPEFLPFRLRQNQNYTFRTRFSAATLGDIRLFKELENFLDLNYTPLPAPLDYDYSVCEFPDEFLECLLDYAKKLSYDKIYPNGDFAISMLTEYERSVSKLRDYRQLAESGAPETVHGVGGGAVHREPNSDFTSLYGDVDF